MKNILVITWFLSSTGLSLPVLAEGEVEKMMKPVEEKKHSSDKERRRRKKVQMCHECGKPETECDCEGEDHGVETEPESED